MLTTLIIFLSTCIFMVLAVLFVPTVKLGRTTIDAYWIVTLIGALALIITGQLSLSDIFSSLTANTAVNPLKILVLFICMTILSIFLDELGFFRYIADLTLIKAGHSQYRLFAYLYIIVSVLTVFTSNDIIILSFTPFICYFAKNARINPIPYLAAEFVAANTWSMALIIGNPTNIYLTTAYNIGFFDYLKVMLLPTLAAGATAFIILYLLFKKSLSVPIEATLNHVDKIADPASLTVGTVHLAICTLALAVSSYIGVEMWLVSLLAVISLSISVGVISIVRHHPSRELAFCIRRAPWQLIPFMLSMFIIVIAVSSKGIAGMIADTLGENLGIFKYGITSFLAANLINNIPMSVLYSSVIENVSSAISIPDVYATVIGSNIGAFLTPIGALAGIMWSSILKRQGVPFRYLDFLKIGITVAIPTLTAALFTLNVLI